MENEKSQDLHPASWRSGRSNVEFQSESKSLRTGRANGVNSSLKVGGLNIQKEWQFQFKSKV